LCVGCFFAVCAQYVVQAIRDEIMEREQERHEFCLEEVGGAHLPGRLVCWIRRPCLLTPQVLEFFFAKQTPS
jgi:hypothetical protein